MKSSLKAENFYLCNQYTSENEHEMLSIAIIAASGSKEDSYKVTVWLRTLAWQAKASQGAALAVRLTGSSKQYTRPAKFFP
jgi:hypothetical protein